ncbi:hypothetical protein M011DRAFT_463984 [Sporormia fimetaria CBS 119925]|uniref:Uncharacterized protein n=1 Tax=Sporormia fimetaria CBS 119925 TaxID=1340428 RepID=A0A6A6VM69_9PLEO|nr:hypothetical protein M011DRAFT_463984 [Sporormia fimetaria CBS 119925]
MPLFARIKQSLPILRDHYKTENHTSERSSPPPPSAALASPQSIPDTPNIQVTHWDAQHTKAKIAEVRKKWRRPSIPAITPLCAPGARLGSSSPPRLSYRPNRPQPAPLAVKDPDPNVQGVPALQSRPSVRRSKLFENDAQPSDRSSRASSFRNDSVCSPRSRRSYAESSITSESTPVTSNKQPRLRRVATMKGTLKRSASQLLSFKAHQAPEPSSIELRSRRYEDCELRSPPTHSVLLPR